MTVKKQRFRKRPIEIDAMQFTGGPAAATPIINWMLGWDCAATWSEAHDGGHIEGWDPYPAKPEGITIQTLEGDMLATVGDWIIRGVKGEFYPCKPSIFEATYEEVPHRDALGRLNPKTISQDVCDGGHDHWRGACLDDNGNKIHSASCTCDSCRPDLWPTSKVIP